MSDFDPSASSAEIAEYWQAGSDEAEDVLFARAGAGETEAQRIMAFGMAAWALGEPEYAEVALAASEVFARMAASRGDPEDRRRLAGVLSLQAAHCRSTARPEAATACEAQCLVILNQLADEGHEEAALTMNTLAAEFSQEAVSEALKRARSDAAEAPVERVVNIAPPPIDWEAALASLPPLTRWERVKFWFSDRFWDVRYAWWGLTDRITALFGR